MFTIQTLHDIRQSPFTKLAGQFRRAIWMLDSLEISARRILFPKSNTKRSPKTTTPTPYPWYKQDQQPSHMATRHPGVSSCIVECLGPIPVNFYFQPIDHRRKRTTVGFLCTIIRIIRTLNCNPRFSWRRNTVSQNQNRRSDLPSVLRRILLWHMPSSLQGGENVIR